MTDQTSGDIPTVTEVIVQADYVICPHCSEEVDGWLGDPRGKVESCDSCNKEFRVHTDADLEMR